MKSWTAKILISLFSIGLVAGTFFVEEKLNASAPANAGQLDVQIVEKSIRKAPNTVAEAVLDKTAENRNLSISLKRGRLWINTLNFGVPAVIQAGEIRIFADPGVFDIRYENGNLQMAAFRRSLEIDFLGKRLVLPESRRIEISEAKIKKEAGEISKLLYSKLAKEFPYSALDKPDEWVSENMSKDEAFQGERKRSVSEDIRNAGAKHAADESSLFVKLDEAIKRADFVLTVDSVKKSRKEADANFDYFDSAAYALVIGKEDLAQKWLEKFKAGALQLNNNSFWKEKLEENIHRFAYVVPSDAMSVLETTLSDAGRQTPIGSLRSAFQNILDIAAENNGAETQLKTEVALRQLGALVNSKIKSVNSADSGISASDGLFFEYVRFSDFLAGNPDLLREEFLRISEFYERAHLALVASREAADDQRQFLMGEKIRTIGTLKELMGKGDMSLQDSRKAILFVANQIEGLKPTFSDTAVLAYYDGQLEEMQPLISFLRSSGAENLRGSFDENFKQFQTDLEEMGRVQDLLTTAEGGEQISAFRREELAGIVTADFTEASLSGVRVTLPDVEGDPRVKVVAGQLEGKSFKAVYDTARKVFSDIEFDSEKISNAVKLANLKKFFMVKLGQLVLPGGAAAETLTEAPNQQSMLEKVAKAKSMEEFIKIGISVEDKYLGLEDLGQGVIHVRLAALGEGANAKVFAFDVSQKSSVVSNLKVQTVSGEVSVNDEFALRELPVKVEQIYQRAVFEKQKEEEMKKYLDSEEVNG